ncbi:hypothetical protein C8J57DRAFT_1243195 [Mycena rebaudengoi]|nr:hypothetical protein C8J57DRAFT_1243195 [Mycena rebaudengoi]
MRSQPTYHGAAWGHVEGENQELWSGGPANDLMFARTDKNPYLSEHRPKGYGARRCHPLQAGHPLHVKHEKFEQQAQNADFLARRSRDFAYGANKPVTVCRLRNAALLPDLSDTMEIPPDIETQLLLSQNLSVWDFASFDLPRVALPVAQKKNSSPADLFVKGASTAIQPRRCRSFGIELYLFWSGQTHFLGYFGEPWDQFEHR